MQKDPKSGELEGTSYEFNLCEAVATWEQVSDPNLQHCQYYVKIFSSDSFTDNYF